MHALVRPAAIFGWRFRREERGEFASKVIALLDGPDCSRGRGRFHRRSVGPLAHLPPSRTTTSDLQVLASPDDNNGQALTIPCGCVETSDRVGRARDGAAWAAPSTTAAMCAM